ncbi:MAG: transposase [Rhizobacter sp.]|nr:transposase [Rhizobacter sp.]
MARLSRLCIPGLPHLVLQRGRDGTGVFEDHVDRQLFRELLKEASLRLEVQIHAYALQSEQVLLLVTPTTAEGLSKLIQDVGRRYVAAFNRRHGRAGGLWEGRFRATVVAPDEHLLSCMRFVEGLAGGMGSVDPTAVRWTSAPHHLGEAADPLITEPLLFWKLGNTPFEREAGYRLLSEHALTQAEVTAITAALSSAWPLGSDVFLAELAEKTDRRLKPAPRGRPRKGRVQLM